MQTPNIPSQDPRLRCLPGGNWAPAQAPGTEREGSSVWWQGQGTHRVPRVYCPYDKPCQVGSISPTWLSRKLREGQG